MIDSPWHAARQRRAEPVRGRRNAQSRRHVDVLWSCLHQGTVVACVLRVIEWGALTCMCVCVCVSPLSTLHSTMDP